jgi:DNA-binding NarL/FixJ family response regulator
MKRNAVLLVSRYTNLLPFYKSYFEWIGFSDIHTTDKDKDGLNMLINELRPRRIFIASNFYSIATPYMVGILHKMFPKIHITVVTTGDFSENMAVWFIYHGANSYVSLLDGIEELKNGLRNIRDGEDYISPAVKRIIDSLDEKPDCNLKITKRQKEILFMICNGFSREKIEEELHISSYTICYHLKELMKIFHVHSKEELIKIAVCLDIVAKNNLCFNADKKLIASLPDWARAQININKINKKYGG